MTPRPMIPLTVNTISAAAYPGLLLIRLIISGVFRHSMAIFDTRLKIRVASSAPGRRGALSGTGPIASLISAGMS